MMKMGGQDAACRTEPHLLLPLLVPDLGVVVNARHDGRLRPDDDAALLREDRRGPNRLEIKKESTHDLV